MKQRVLICGTFDLFHIGHLNVLKSARALGDALVVAIHVDTHNTKGVDIFYPPEVRAQMISEFRCVDSVVFYESMDALVKEVDFDILCHGPDNKSPTNLAAYAWCRAHGKTVHELPRTPGISSSDLRAFLTGKNFS